MQLCDYLILTKGIYRNKVFYGLIFIAALKKIEADQYGL